MTNVIQLRGSEQLHEEAALWLARLDRGLSERENDELAQWIKADYRHHRALLELAALWDQMGVLAELAGLFPLEQPTARIGRRAWVRPALAAAVVCAAVLVWAVRAFLPYDAGKPDPTVVPAVSQLFETSIGERVQESLSDGSVVMLNTDTALRVSYSDAARDIFLLRGEAHFDVAPDPAHPFRVHVGARIVEAVGTAFNVEVSRDGEIEVTVTEGEVKVIRVAEPAVRPESLPRVAIAPIHQFEVDTELIEGEVAILDQAAMLDAARPQVTQLKPVEVDMKLAWQRGMLIFQGEPLRDMLEEVARYTTTEFVLEDEQLGALRVGGYFKAGDIEGLLVSLHDGFNIASERVGNDRILLHLAR